MQRSPWQLAPDDLLRTLRGAGGQLFTDFVDALVRAEAAQAGISPDKIATNIRTNIGDGGVDTFVKVPLHGTLQIEAPSAWQYKATDYTQVTGTELEKEMRKQFAAARIREGDVYCLCICDDAPAERKEALLAQMREIARSLRVDCREPRLLCAGELADWASRFPAVVLRFFRPQLELGLPYEAWLRKERADLPTYVELSSRSEATRRIQHYVDFQRPADGVLTVGGAIGIGKSRFVAESLQPVGSLVLYLIHPEAALTTASYLVNNPSARAVMAVDGCTTAVRLRLAHLIRGIEDRVRAIIINDSAEETADVRVVIEPLEYDELHKVLEANFGDIGPSHRRAIAHLSDGVLQIAALLGARYRADRHRFMADAGASAFDVLWNAVQDRNDRLALQALSLFPRLGFKGEVGQQLERVCELLRLDPADMIDRYRRLGRTPGVVEIGVRYVSVRPRLFVRRLLEEAWARWVANDFPRFLDSLPEDLRVRFVRQIAAHGAEHQREAIADWASDWLAGLSSRDLCVAASLELLLALVQVSPARVAPRLADLVVGATSDELRDGEQLSHWSTWMHVRWTLRDLLGWKATYHHAERALYHMATAENDVAAAARQGAGTASGIWSSSFRIFLSGTEVPFTVRLRKLSERLDEQSEESTALVLEALNEILSSHSHRTEGVPLVAGQVRPEEWRPKTYGEYSECLEAALDLLRRCMASQTGRRRAVEILRAHGRGLLGNGMLDALRAVVEVVPLDETTRVAALGCVREFLRYDCEPGDDGDGYPAEYVARVEEWRQQLERNDLGGRLLQVIGATHWSDDESEWLGELQDLAAAFYEEMAELESRLPWLVTCEGNGSALLEFGRSIGKLDAAGKLIDKVFQAAEQATNPLFLRGYLLGLPEKAELDSRVGQQLDELERFAPSLAVELNRMVPRVSSPEQRALRLVREGRLDPSLLHHHLSLLKPEFVAEALETVLEVLSECPEDAAAIGLALVSSMAWSTPDELPRDARSAELLWKLLDVAMQGARAEAHVWGRLLRRLAERDFDRALHVCCRAFISSEFAIQEEAAKELAVFIREDPERCLATLGPMILAAEPWIFSLGRRKHALNTFPVDVMKRWLEVNGAAAARRIAPCLPLPFVTPDGSPVVPALTEFVLERFEDDDVYAAFAHGRHNGQIYRGDIAAQHEAEAARAAPFRNHPLRRIRQWANEEVAAARRRAQCWRERHEEDFGD